MNIAQGLLTLFILSNFTVAKAFDVNGDLPPSISALNAITDKEGIDYSIASYKATMDILNASKGYLKNSDSAKALKMLSLGTTLFPYRDDVQALKTVALGRFTQITIDMIKNDSITCNDIKERVNFLRSVAPDAINNLKVKRDNCDYMVKELDHVPTVNEISKATAPKSIKELEEKYNLDLSKELSYAMWREDFLPKEDLTLLYLRFMGSFKMSPSSINIELSKDKLTASISSPYEFKREGEDIDSGDFCDEIEKLVAVQSTKIQSCMSEDIFGKEVNKQIPVGNKVKERLSFLTSKPLVVLEVVFELQDGSTVIHDFLLKVDLDTRFSYKFFNTGITGTMNNNFMRATNDTSMMLDISTRLTPPTFNVRFVPIELLKKTKSVFVRNNPLKTKELYIEHVFKK